MQSQVLNPPVTDTGDTIIQEGGKHADEIFESVFSEVNRQVQTHIEQLRSEIACEVKKEMHELIDSEVEKQLHKCIEETRVEITTDVKKDMSKLIASEVGEQLQKGREKSRARSTF